MAKSEIEWGAIRVASLPCMKMPDETYQRLKMHGRDVQQMVNFIWQRWLVWHFEKGSRAKIEANLKAYAAWKETGVGEKPKLDLLPIPKPLGKSLYADLTAAFPTVHARVRVLLTQIVQQKITSRKAANGSLPGWWAILLGNESLPNTRHENPIPFDTQNASLIPAAEKGGNWKLSVKVTRVPTQGKVSPSVVDELELWSSGRKAAGQVAILRKVASGDWKFRGSNLLLRNDGKWYAQIVYSMPLGEEIRPAVDPAKVAFLRPSKSWPWKLRLPGRNRRPGGRGYHVGVVRKQLIQQRWSRQACYRNASSARQGHGRQHAQDIVTRLTNRWRDFVKTFNHQVTNDVVTQLVAAGVGRVVFFQPSSKLGETRLLSTAGKIEDRRESSGWDWFQVGTMLAYKCQRFGIECVVRKPGEKSEGSGDEKTTGTARKAQKLIGKGVSEKRTKRPVGAK